MPGSILGTSVRRREDPRLVTGRGRFVADISPPGMLHAAFARSTLAHARVLRVDSRTAQAMPGVAGVYVASDLGLRRHLGAAILAETLAHPPLAAGVVRYVGDPVAVVLAETPEQAADAVLAVEIEYETLPALVDPLSATGADAAPIFPEHGHNVAFATSLGGDEDALAGADVVVRSRFLNQRLAAVPLEGNAILAVPAGDGLEVWVSSQAPHRVRDDIAEFLGLPEALVRVVAPDVGGGFGAKLVPYPEHLVVARLARETGRPVRWVETRSEGMTSMTQGRGQVQDVELGATRAGGLVGMRLRLVQDAGAYPGLGAFLPYYTGMMAPGVYRLPRFDFAAESVVTNTTPISSYRGAGRPEATALVERAMDMLAGELGCDPADLRRQNLIRRDEFPYTTAGFATYDVGDYERALSELLRVAGYEQLRAEQAERRRSGDARQLGIGLSLYVEITAGVSPTEFGAVEVLPDGSVVVRAGTASTGQGHETAYAQIVADRLGVPQDSVRLVQGDTAEVPRGDGSSSSRSIQLGGSAAAEAAVQVLDKARLLAGHLLEVSPDDVIRVDGGLGVAGVPARSLTWAELAVAASDPARLPEGAEPGLAAEADFYQDGATFPFGAHLALVEVDTETGQVRALKHFAVDDCGRVINPMLAEGQVHGGVAQGLAQALYEEVLYDVDGNPRTTSLLDYGVPTIAEIPEMIVVHIETPTPLNPLGAKGIGESGTIGSTPAVQNAVVDALSHLGIRHIDMPLTPDRVWAAIKKAGA